MAATGLRDQIVTRTCAGKQQKIDPSTAPFDRDSICSLDVVWAALFSLLWRAKEAMERGLTGAVAPSPLALSHHSWLAEYDAGNRGRAFCSLQKGILIKN